MCIALCFLALLPGSVVGTLTVSYIDVGQGDAELLQSHGQYMLIDAGPADAGNKVVSYLKQRGVSHLDYVVATHPHEDHIGGMMDVLNAFSVGTYIDSGATHTTKTYEDLMRKLVTDQTRYATVNRGKTFGFGDTNVEVLGPSSISGDLNADSVALKVTDGGISFLFLGDAEQVASPATILKVAHHGSAGSTHKLGAINPEVAIIEVGAGNSYGHPTSGTISNLNNANVEVYRTDKNGNIAISSDGSTYSINAERGSSTMSFSEPSPIATVASISKPTPMRTVAIPNVASIPVAPPVYKTVQVQSSSPSSSASACDCSSNSYNCKDFPLSNGMTAQECYNYCKAQGKGDIHGLDRDKDGLACEG